MNVDCKVSKDLRVFKEKLVLLVHKDHRVNKVRKVNVVCKVSKVLKEFKVRLVLLVHKVHRANVVCKVK